MSHGAPKLAGAAPWLVVGGFAALVFLGLGRMSVIDYDEAVYAEVARGMLVSGDWLRPSLGGEPWYEKPPWLYWSMLSGMGLFGVSALGVRFANALAAVGLVGLVYAAGRRPLGRRGALASAVVLASSVEMIVLARVALTDLWLTFWITACLTAFHRAWEISREGGSGRAWFAFACLCSAGAMLSKGLVGFVLPAGAIGLAALRDRRLAALFRPDWLAVGLPLLFGVGLSWYLALGASDGFGFMSELFWEHHVGRFLEPKESHSGPFFYYAPVLAIGLLPWSPLLPWAAGRAGFGDGSERARFLFLMSALAGLTFVFFSLAATKLPNYVAPVLPGLAWLIGAAARPGREPEPAEASWRWGWRIAAGLQALLAAAFLTAPWLLAQLPGWISERGARRLPGLLEPLELGVAPIAAGAVFLAGAVASVRAGRSASLPRLGLALAAPMCALVPIAVLGILPRYEAHFREPLHVLARQAAERSPASTPIVLIDLKRVPSVSFHSGRATRRVGRHGAEELGGLCAAPGGRIGIASGAVFEAMRGAVALAALERRGGYVLFECGEHGAGRGQAG